MDVMTLAAKLTLNTSEFDASLEGSEKKTKELTSGGVAWGNLLSSAFQTAARYAKEATTQTVKVGMAFDQQMSQVKALGQLTDEDFIKVRKRAMELGASTKFTAEQVGEAFSYMALAGWNTDEMLAGIDGVLNLAAASGEDLGRVSDIVTDALTAFGLGAEDAGHFVDVLAAASANSNTTVAQMGEAFKYLATTGGVMKYSIDDVATALGLLANSGIKASQAGTSMRQILNTLINPSDKAAEAIGNLGISLFDPETNARKPLAQVLQEFRDIFKDAGLQMEEGFDPAELQERLDKLNEWYDQKAAEIEKMPSGRKKAMKNLNKLYEERLLEEIHPNQAFLAKLGDIGGLRGISSLFAIMNSTDDDFQQLMDAISGSKGAAGEMATTMLDNLAGDITILNSALEGLQIVVSDSFKNDLRGFIQTLTEEVGNLNEAFQQGGALAMFTNLADWVINGITGALMDSDVTGEQAGEFGKAIGDFVGRTVAHLVQNAPKLIEGLFNAGLNLAGGLIEGLFAGMFGTGEGTVTGLITRLGDEEEKAIQEANQSATQARGILSYMDSLTAKYGDAAKNTEEWATAFEKLKEVYPQINEFIKQEGGELSTTNTNLMEYIENTKERMVADAKRAALQSMTDTYVAKVQEQGTAEIKAELAQEQADEAWNALVEYIQRTNKSFTGEGMDIQQLMYVAYGAASELGETTTYIEAMKKTYEEQTAEAKKWTDSIDTLKNEAEVLKAEMEIAERALSRFASSVDSSSGEYTSYGAWKTQQYKQQYAEGSHASGLWNVPYDDYVARLHHGETVLSASQARRYKEGTGADLTGLEDRIIAAIRAGMSDATVNAYIDGKRVTDQVNRYNTNDLNSRRYAP